MTKPSPTPTPLRESILRGADILDQRTKFDHDRAKYMNASEAFTCVRRQWFSKHMPEAGTQQNWGFARRGQQYEKYVVECLRASNIPLAAVGEEQVSLVSDDYKIAGTPDGYVDFGDGITILEIKSVDAMTKKDSLPRKNHVAQVQINIALYNYLYGAEGSRAIGGKIIYGNASNYDDIMEFDIEAPEPNFLDELKGRVNKILRTQKVDMLDREGKVRDFGKECKYCPFVEACGVSLDNPNEATTGRKGSKLHSQVLVLRDLRLAGKDAKNQEDAVKADIVASMEREGITRKEYPADNIYVEIVHVSGKTTLDKALVAKTLGDLSAYQTVGKPSRRVDIKPLT